MSRAPTSYEAARRRVEAGDFSLDAVGAMAIAHGQELLAASDALDRSAPLRHMMGSDGSAFCGAVRGDRSKDRTAVTCPACREVMRDWR